MILQAFVRGAIIIAIAALIATLLRHRSAALRHHVWATAVVVQLALLAFIPVLPTIHLPVIPVVTVKTDAAPETNTLTSGVETASDAEIAPVTSGTRTTETPERSDPPPRRERTVTDYLLLAWMAGAGIILLRYIVGTLMMLRVAIKGERIEDGEWLVLAQRTARELGITRPVTMIWGDKVSVPITWGVLYPMILLPKSAQEWTLERRRFVLVHEMAHVKRFDALTQLLAQFTAAIFWFSPFVWFAEWRMRVEREHACDDTVIEHGTEPAVYADELLQMVRSLVRRRAPQPAFAALAMARKSEFEGRMLAILDPERPRRVTGITSGLVFALLSVLIAAPLAAIDPFAFRVTTAPASSQSVASPQPPAPAPAPAQPATASGKECEVSTGGDGITINVGPNNEVDIRMRRDARCTAGLMSGPVELSADEQRIMSVRPGGFVRLQEWTSNRDLQLVIDNSRNGGLWRSFTINGRVPDDDGRTEREWVARVLPELLAEGAIEPQERVLRMLKSNGLNATIAQISRLSAYSARLAHFTALVNLGGWSDAELERIHAGAVTALKSSPKDAAEFEKVFPKKSKPESQPVSNAARRDVDMMEKVLAGISSSYDLHMAMKSQLDHADRDVLLLFGRTAGRIGSGYEAASFLIAAQPYYFGRNDPGLEDAWFGAIVKVGSSLERARALTSLLDVVPGSERLTFKLINATGDMSSSTDKAGVLTAIAKKKLITTPALRTAFLAQVNTITTGVDRRLILEAL